MDRFLLTVITKSDIHVVIRSNNERTVGLCYFLACKQLTMDQITLIKEKPFEKAVLKTFEIGKQYQEKKILIGLDADILLFGDAMDYVTYIMNQRDAGKTFRVDFPIFDKFKGRVHGVHVYNNFYSSDFYQFYSSLDLDRDINKKESHAVELYCEGENLRANERPRFICAKHDYFQFFRDIFEKNRSRFFRMNDDTKKTMLNFLYLRQKESIDDFDYNVALEGLFSVETGKNCNRVLADIDLCEKESLSPDLYPVIMKTLSKCRILPKVSKETSNWK